MSVLGGEIPIPEESKGLKYTIENGQQIKMSSVNEEANWQEDFLMTISSPEEVITIKIISCEEEDTVVDSFTLAGREVEDKLSGDDHYQEKVKTDETNMFTYSINVKSDENTKLKALKAKIVR